MNRYLLLFLSVFIYLISSGQDFSNLKSKKLVFDVDTIQLDSLSIIPNSVFLENEEGEILKTTKYTIDASKGQLIWLGKKNGKVFTIKYRTFPYNLAETKSNKDIKQIETYQKLNKNPFIYVPGKENLSDFDFGDLNYNGSFSRGLSFGNSQDVVLNSSLNLQFAGLLNNDVEVLAAISDNNIPIQTEGNTQQLQEFDKIYITLRKDKTQLTLGDLQLQKPSSYFLNFNKKTQGAQFATSIGKKRESIIGIEGNVGISKGQYARNQFLGKEGNQGPYKLTGNNGETFIVILSGTERVFIDGIQLKRGAEYDYVIDYNSGELTFTPNELMTKDKRISIEFQYADQNYLRTLTNAKVDIINKDFDFRFNVYAEQDSKNQPLLRELSPTDKLNLINAGDDLSKAFSPGFDSVAFDMTRVLYKMVDSLGYDSIFVYSTNPDSAKYALNFALVEQGNYIIASENSANGRVYNWVAPIAGVPQGNYEPIEVLVPPNSRQLYTAGLDYKLSKKGTLGVELALSNVDVNTFSKIGNQNNIGAGFMLKYKNEYQLNKRDSTKKSKTVLITELNHEFINKVFAFIERYRAVEFNRNWNKESDVTKADEYISNAFIGIKNNKKGQLNYKLTSFIRSGSSKGFMHSTNSNYHNNGFDILLRSSYLSSSSITESTMFLRPYFEFSKQFKKLNGVKTGFIAEEEKNQIRILNTDSLSSQSFMFDRFFVYIKNADTAKNQIEVLFTHRKDYLPKGNILAFANKGNTIEIKGGLLSNRNNVLRWNVKYRELIVNDSSLATVKPEQTALGRVQHDLRYKKGLIRFSTLYEVGAGQERKLEYQFIAVLDGTGTHTWIDFNNDSIQQKNEFIIANFADEADYKRVFTFTNEFVNANIIRFNESIVLNPKVIWYRKKGLKGFFAKFSTQNNLQINRKVFAQNTIPVFNPFDFKQADSVLLSSTIMTRNSLFFNRTGSKFSLEATKLDNQSKQLLLSGFDTKLNNEYLLKGKLNIGKVTTVRVEYKTGENSRLSEIFPQNNYDLRTLELKPSISFLSKSIYRLTVSYLQRQDQNVLEYGGEKADNKSIVSEFRYNVVAKSTINLKFTYTTIKLNGQKNTPAAVAMLQGLQPGNNILWNITYEKNISKNVLLSVSYDGRRTGENNIIHVGRAQARALF